jgi:hypothetical protein
MRRSAELTSFLVGAAVALALLASWRVPPGHGTVGADITFSVALSPTITLSQTGPFANAANLTAAAGDALSGSVYARNASAGRVAVRARVRGNVHDLDRALHVELLADGRRFYSGPLSGLANWTRQTVVLDGNRNTQITVRGRLLPGSEHQYAGRIAVATLELRREEAS